MNMSTYSLIWVLDQCCWSYFHKCCTTLDITRFNNSPSAARNCECQILLCQILLAFRHKNNSLPYYLTLLNTVRVLLKDLLINLRAYNFSAHKNLFTCTLHGRSSPCTQFVKPWLARESLYWLQHRCSLWIFNNFWKQ